MEVTASDFGTDVIDATGMEGRRHTLVGSGDEPLWMPDLRSDHRRI